ncbi:MAG: hypothetical protein L0Z54_03910, partial [Thermoplasmata archaeon]|nr:hypothetical protein [Thermoplasmata archaeon]
MMTSRAILHVVLVVMAAAVLSYIADGAESAWTDHSNATHIHLKADGSLSPEIDPGANTSVIHVEADYDEVGSMRTNRRWVDIGTWSVALDVDWQAAGGLTTVSFWYRDVDEGYVNSPRFNATLNVSGVPVANSTADGPGDADSPTQINVTLDLSTDIYVREGEAIEVYLEFIGWEDIEFYYDNTTYPSGWTQNSTSLLFEDITGTNRTVDLEFVDAFDVDWTLDPDQLYVYAHPADDAGGDQDPKYRLHNFTALDGDPVQVGNSTKATTVLRFEADMSEGNWTIGARFGYNGWSYRFKVERDVTIESDGPRTWIVDDDNGTWRDFEFIQDAIDAASDGDTVLVYAGTYREPGLRV